MSAPSGYRQSVAVPLPSDGDPGILRVMRVT